MWAFEGKVLKNFFLRLSSRAFDTVPVNLGVNHRAVGVKHKQMAATFEWHLCTTVTVSPLIIVEIIHSWSGESNQWPPLSPSLLCFLTSSVLFYDEPVKYNFQENFHPYYPPQKDQY